MYLSSNEIDLLSNIVLNFEVAYRSYISDSIFKVYTTKSDLKNELLKLSQSIQNSSVILSGYFSNKLSSTASADFDKFYDNLRYSYDCYMNKDYEENNENDVPFASTIVDITFYFYQTIFSQLSSSFKSNFDFLTYSNKYKVARNDSSHRGSKKISIDDANITITFIDKVIDFLEEKYFWYKSKPFLKAKINDFQSINTPIDIPINNIYEIPFTDTKFVCRENVVQDLKKKIYGGDLGLKPASSIVIYGYGGVGKTALVLEFIKQLLVSYKERIAPENYKLDFLLFFTSKEESLDYSERDGNLYIKTINKQISGFAELKLKLKQFLKTDDFSTITKHGLIIIDNVETFGKSDKEELLRFIRYESSRSVQYILTSRNEEDCDDRIGISEFKLYDGKLFIDEYIEKNDMNLLLNETQKEELIDLSKGNTLVLVLVIHRLSLNIKTIDTLKTELDQQKYIIDKMRNELRSVSQSNLEKIADFMYKNTFDEAINELSSMNIDVPKIITVITLYNEDIDLYTLSSITKIPIIKVDKACSNLAKKLVLEKNGELYRLNEFAAKYVLIKYIPASLEYATLKDAIEEKKCDIREKLNNMEKLKEANTNIKNTLQDWKPNNYIDEVAISQVLTMYKDIKTKLEQTNKREDISKIFCEFLKEFEEYAQMTPHPYILYQKARILKLFAFGKKYRPEDMDILSMIKNAYEETILQVEYSYIYIKNTISYACVLWTYGEGLLRDNDFNPATKKLEDALELFKNKGLSESENYCSCALSLIECYIKMYKANQEQRKYLSLADNLLKTKFVVKSAKFTGRYNWLRKFYFSASNK